MRIEAFVIHLARASGRRNHVASLSARLPLKVRVLDAVDGLSMPEAAIAASYRANRHSPHYPFELRKQEIACFHSHRKAWQAILDQGLDAGLVVEDDVEVDDSFPSVLAAVLENCRPDEFVRFPRRGRGEKGPEIFRSGYVSVLEPELPGHGMQMQLVGSEAAKALLAATQFFDRPVDTTIQLRWAHGVRVLSARPICIREIATELGGTVIHSRKKLDASLLLREIRRPLYRLALRLRSMRNPVGLAG